MSPTTRITAGEWRGRVIDTPRTMSIRPTRSLVRETLFNILGERVVGASVLDLYAGAGTVGFEALSRGAASVAFVERNEAVLRFIAATAERLGATDRSRMVRAEVQAWLRREGEVVETFGIAFVDAPYQDADLDRSLALLGKHPPSLVVCEHHSKRHLPGRIGRLDRVREVRHGLTTLTFLQPSTDEFPT
ncbi:MAG: 16S rRNA (guanine(966)-N(2))-methyltransferase RsmD [Candidatus Dormibacteraeota bacterium]|nr:16S rRNA (guanine(966)-N(2))-methyltransferase RsmD [Candidatus Dormibacteraeota bacterium]